MDPLNLPRKRNYGGQCTFTVHQSPWVSRNSWTCWVPGQDSKPCVLEYSMKETKKYRNENTWALTRPPATYPCQYSCPIGLLTQTFHTLHQWRSPSTKFWVRTSKGSGMRELNDRHTDRRDRFYTLDRWRGREWKHPSIASLPISQPKMFGQRNYILRRPSA